MRLNLKLSHKGLILVSVPLIFELIFLATLTALLRQAEIEVQRQVRSKAIISQANTLSKLFYDAGVAMGGYSITKSPLFSDRYDKIVHQIPQDLEELRTLVGDNQRQQQILQNLKKITEDGLAILTEAKSAIDDNRVDVAQFRARHMYKEIRSLADRLQDELRGLTEDERKIESEGPEAQNRSRAMVKIFLVVGVVFNVLLAVALALFFSRGIGKRLNVLTDNTIRLARGEPLNDPLTGSDEIAHLDGVFHSMADALIEASRKERAIIENAVDVICSIDVDGKFVAVSPACFQVWGHKPEELMGRRFIELVIPEDHQETIRAVRAVRAEKGRTQFENRTRRKDGTTVTVLWSTYWSETERSMFCVAHDITQRKLAEEAIRASEERIRRIVENMLVGLIIMTKEGFIEQVNPACERIFGYRAEELVGRHLMMLFHDATLFSVNSPADCKNFMDQVFQKSLNRVGELDAMKRIGEPFPIELSLSEMEMGEGRRYLANILDVSERREVERLKKEFVSTVSHELRTPLTSIRGSLTLLSVGALGSLPDQAKKVVGIAERNTIRLITLINDILDIEKLESGKLDMEFAQVTLSNVMERSDQAVRAFAEQNGIKLEMIPSKATVFADGDRLVQVMVNLISNAVKFSPKGGTVTVSMEEIPNWVEVKVVDRGRGIPAKYKGLLFQRFQQVDASDSKKKGGTGLGLAICKGIIEAHNGTIGVESEEGQGSCFWFRIPPVGTAKAPPPGQFSQSQTQAPSPPLIAQQPQPAPHSPQTQQLTPAPQQRPTMQPTQMPQHPPTMQPTPMPQRAPTMQPTEMPQQYQTQSPPAMPPPQQATQPPGQQQQQLTQPPGQQQLTQPPGQQQTGQQMIKLPPQQQRVPMPPQQQKVPMPPQQQAVPPPPPPQPQPQQQYGNTTQQQPAVKEEKIAG